MVISLATGMPLGAFHGGIPANSYPSARGFDILPLREAAGPGDPIDGPLTPLLDEMAADGMSDFDPNDSQDPRERALRAVVARRGQAQFRQALLQRFRGACAITGCAVVQILEAAHITPYCCAASNDVCNGLLLRADIHALWDLGLVAVDPDELTTWVSPTITDPAYRALHGQAFAQSPATYVRPSLEALRVPVGAGPRPPVGLNRLY